MTMFESVIYFALKGDFFLTNEKFVASAK